MMIFTQDGKAITSTDNLNYIEIEEKELNYKKMRENVKNQFFCIFSVKWI